MPKRLEDLYRRGAPVTLDDGDGDTVTIWVQKLDPVQQDAALSHANAAQAAVLSSQFTEDDEWKTVLADVLQMETEEVVDQLVSDHRSKRLAIVVHRVAVSEPWSTDGYLEGIQHIWNDELKFKPEDDPEVKRVRDELMRFDAEVAEQMDAEVEDYRRELSLWPTEELVKEKTKRALKFKALLRWQRVYNDWVLFYAIRDSEDSTKQLYADPQQVFRLDSNVKTRLVGEYTKIVVDVTEGKESPGQPGSSTSSEPAELAATNDSSGQRAA